MNLTDYLGRVERAVRINISRDAQVLAVYETERSERAGYWERIYAVAWSTPGQSGTHRVCIDSTERAMLVWGHYYIGDGAEAEALEDLRDRIDPQSVLLS